ncbi:MAG: T9SS type A sorting domain-containing protein [Bacteroidetes bacterium]|nr:T9SS type A sorting domain-containing protein [Bacteroidota bacterium]
MKKQLTVTAILIFSFSFTFGQFTKLYDFNDIGGRTPNGSLVSDGTYLYGMTYNGGVNGKGTVFKIKSDGNNFIKLLDFDGTNGWNPRGSLFFDGEYLYGMTWHGGTNGGYGVLFKLKPDGTAYTKLYDFDNTNGYCPNGSLYSDGKYLYGMTAGGGTNGWGVIFKIKPDGTDFTKIFDFDGVHGAMPDGTLISYGTHLYGTTHKGGSHGYGVIFKIKPDGTDCTTLFNFDLTNGSFPNVDLVTDGIYLYGATSQGGANGSFVRNGVVFKIKPDGTDFTKLHEFVSVNSPFPNGSLIYSNPYLYGTTLSGGAYNLGFLYKIKTDGTDYVKMFDFRGTYGAHPLGSLISDGIYLYGTTSEGGAKGYDSGYNGNGIVFKINKNTVVTGIQELSSDNSQLKIYPNPVSEILNIELEIENVKTEIKIIDVLGKEVIQHSSFNSYNSIDVSKLPKGIYFVKAGNEVRKFIKD